MWKKGESFMPSPSQTVENTARITPQKCSAGKKLTDGRKDTPGLHPRTGGLVFSCALFRPAVVDSFLYFLQFLLTAAGKPEHVLI